MLINITVNDQKQQVNAEPGMPLLWVLRDVLALTGTKYGCGRGLCGACTVLVDKRAVRSCNVSIELMEGKSITTIEGLGRSYADGFHPVQAAWIDADVPQCGFCQPGQVMQAAGLLESNAKPTQKQVEVAMSGNLCRCGTYARIRTAIEKVSETRLENAE